MQIEYLGASALRVSRLCLGAMTFGRTTDEAVSRRIIDSARDQGVNFIDTADVYSMGGSEEIVGRAIAADRDRWVVATKFANAMGSEPNQRGYSRKWIFENVDASLRRLGADYIDLLYIHRPLYGEPLSEAVRAIGDLIRQGKIRYYGLSNFHGWRIAEVCRLADALGMERPIASEPLYNIVSREAEVEQLPAAAHYGLGVVAYSALARGVLTAKYVPGSAPDPDSRVGRGDTRILQTEWRPASQNIAQAIARHAEEKGLSAADFALAWVLANPFVSSVIAGPRTEEQWQAYGRALTVELTSEDEAFVDSLVSPGHGSTAGFTDPSYPVEGRPDRTLCRNDRTPFP
ncbi:aldo/keto reductase [Rhizorhabdus sp.]|uniref:aldo/keto reductase n=1 Tax=Rhizorhabdus sp. TaxID=1968843 RepID=UPI001999D7D0|nr:aldo/keto reductase [Rhizorhabdus sp.]MBD3759283.1 aldo/keto reductase [Rhizorhabdus sp.]